MEEYLIFFAILVVISGFAAPPLFRFWSDIQRTRLEFRERELRLELMRFQGGIHRVERGDGTDVILSPREFRVSGLKSKSVSVNTDEKAGPLEGEGIELYRSDIDKSFMVKTSANI